MKRRESRETAFALVFEWSFKDETLDEMIEHAAQSREIVVDDFAYALASKTIARAGELDELIGQYSDKWKLNRLSHVTLAVLRLSLCELTDFADIPVGATINEAVELLKKFATEQDAAYVNGILGAYDRERKGEVVVKKDLQLVFPEPEQPVPLEPELTSDEVVEQIAAELGQAAPEDAPADPQEHEVE